jgi:hypothetical protein
MIVIMPAARARRIISLPGNMIAVGEVMWLRKMTRVRGVTPIQKSSMNFSSVVNGSSIW